MIASSARDHQADYLAVRAAFVALPIPAARKAIGTSRAPGFGEVLRLGRSKSQYHLIFMGNSDLRSNVLEVQNRLARHSAYDLDFGEGNVLPVAFTSLGVRTDEAHLDFLCAVVVKLREVGFGNSPAITAQDAMFKVEDHVLLLLSRLASTEAMIGLWGELFVLDLLLRQGYPIADVISWWTGPDRARFQDSARG